VKIFSWKYAIDADAQKVGEELEEVERNQSITAEHVLEYAERHKDSELHKCFEWNDTEASRKYRLYQARQIICSISVEVKEEPRKIQRVYVSVKDIDTSDRKFKNIKEVLENDEEYRQLVEKAKMDLERCRDKYTDLIEKDDLKDIIFEIYKKI